MWVASGDTAGALETLDELIALYPESPYLGLARAELDADQDPFERKMLLFLNRVEVSLYYAALASKAYVLWHAGDSPGLEQALTQAPDDDRVFWQDPVGKRLMQVRLAFSDRVARRAGELFDQEKWRQAADGYALARRSRLEANGRVYDTEVARQQANEAMAEFNAGRRPTSLRLLGELQIALPDYRPEHIRQMLTDMTRATPR